MAGSCLLGSGFIVMILSVTRRENFEMFPSVMEDSWANLEKEYLLFAKSLIQSQAQKDISSTFQLNIISPKGLFFKLRLCHLLFITDHKKCVFILTNRPQKSTETMARKRRKENKKRNEFPNLGKVAKKVNMLSESFYKPHSIFESLFSPWQQRRKRSKRVAYRLSANVTSGFVLWKYFHNKG